MTVFEKILFCAKFFFFSSCSAVPLLKSFPQKLLTNKLESKPTSEYWDVSVPGGVALLGK